MDSFDSRCKNLIANRGQVLVKGRRGGLLASRTLWRGKTRGTPYWKKTSSQKAEMGKRVHYEEGKMSVKGPRIVSQGFTLKKGPPRLRINGVWRRAGVGYSSESLLCHNRRGGGVEAAQRRN